MNKRLEEILVQSGAELNFVNGVSRQIIKDSFDPIKFAEMIVEDCVSICEYSVVMFDIDIWINSTKKEMTALTALALAEKIKDRFKV